MVDFKSRTKKNSKEKSSNLLELFDRLDRKTTHTDLRETQKQALDQLTKKLTEKDIVLKVSTGAGKTTVALIYLQAQMELNERPVVYLCPTIQLVNQVLEEAEKIGIKAVGYRSGESHPPIGATTAKAIIVCTYDKLFNAKSTFDRTDVELRPCAIVLDDAHAGVEEIRDAFTLNLKGLDAVDEIKKILSKPCADYDSPKWTDIEKTDPYASFEVPYWIWADTYKLIYDKIDQHKDEIKIKFVWPHLKSILRWCRCVVTGNTIEIAPLITPVENVAAYNEATHRMFMSATLADDSVLVRELGCDIQAASKPIIPDSDRGLGERMVLTPFLISKSLDRDWIMKFCASQSRKVNVVVLCPSEPVAREWEAVGATVAMGDDVDQTVADLKSKKSKTKFAVFTQRYDGIDLPDASCRILVIDGMPYGEGTIEKYDASKSKVSDSHRVRLVHRIEQGMGRAVRSHVDYAVVILTGPDLPHFIAKKEVQDLMNADTRAQMNLALKLTEIAREEKGEEVSAEAERSRVKAFKDMVEQSLNRDEDWKQYYNEEVRQPSKEFKGKTSANNLELSKIERDSFKSAIANQFSSAKTQLMTASSKISHVDEQALCIQRAANFLFEEDRNEGLQLQVSAYEKSNLVWCPPRGIQKRPKSLTVVRCTERIKQWTDSFANSNGIISEIQTLKTKLNFQLNHKEVEMGLESLANLVGAQGFRKDPGGGPDVLWIWDSVSLVIEAKNENAVSLHKKDATQLLGSMQWYKETYKDGPKAIPVIAAKVSKMDDPIHFPDGARLIQQTHIDKLIENLEKFYIAFNNELPLARNEQKIKELQQKYDLLPEKFISKYSSPLK